VARARRDAGQRRRAAARRAGTLARAAGRAEAGDELRGAGGRGGAARLARLAIERRPRGLGADDVPGRLPGPPVVSGRGPETQTGGGSLSRLLSFGDVKIATWNVNGIRARQDEVVTFVAQERPDVLCLQEIKAARAHIPG